MSEFKPIIKKKSVKSGKPMAEVVYVGGTAKNPGEFEPIIKRASVNGPKYAKPFLLANALELFNKLDFEFVGDELIVSFEGDVIDRETLPFDLQYINGNLELYFNGVLVAQVPLNVDAFDVNKFTIDFTKDETTGKNVIHWYYDGVLIGTDDHVPIASDYVKKSGDVMTGDLEVYGFVKTSIEYGNQVYITPQELIFKKPNNSTVSLSLNSRGGILMGATIGGSFIPGKYPNDIAQMQDITDIIKKENINKKVTEFNSVQFGSGPEGGYWNLALGQELILPITTPENMRIEKITTIWYCVGAGANGAFNTFYRDSYPYTSNGSRASSAAQVPTAFDFLLKSGAHQKHVGITYGLTSIKLKGLEASAVIASDARIEGLLVHWEAKA